MLHLFQGKFNADGRNLSAIVLISMVPILVLYFFAQKKFIQGYAGGLKG